MYHIITTSISDWLTGFLFIGCILYAALVIESWHLYIKIELAA